MAQQANPKPRTHKECLALCVPGPKQKAFGLGPGAHGLRLVVGPSGTGAWVQRLWSDRKSRDVGIGPIGYVTLAQAKRKAFENRAAKYLGRTLDIGPTPRRATRKPNGPAFRALAAEVIEEHRPSWKGRRTAEQWERTLQDYVFPLIGDKAVGTVTRADVLSVFEQDCDGSILWLAKRRTAEGVMNRLKKILSKAVARGHLQANPVDDALKDALPKANGNGTKHHDAIPHGELGAVLRTLEGRTGTVPLCLRFVALTAVRASEARLARWSEIDLEAPLWTIPGERMKAGNTHEVPLSEAALDVLRAARKLSSGDRVFPGHNGGDMNPTTLLANWRRAGLSGTVHGLRSAFRDWCAETGVARELAERCLAHAVGNSTEAAYYRTTQLEQRRELMDRWGGYLNG